MFYRMRSPERWDKPDLEIFQVEEQMTRGIGIRERKEGKNNARKWNVYSYDTLPIVGGQKYIYRTIFWRRREFYYYYFFLQNHADDSVFHLCEIYIYIYHANISSTFSSLWSLWFDSIRKIKSGKDRRTGFDRGRERNWEKRRHDSFLASRQGTTGEAWTGGSKGNVRKRKRQRTCYASLWARASRDKIIHACSVEIKNIIAELIVFVIIIS